MADNRPVTEPVGIPPASQPSGTGVSSRNVLLGLGALVLLGALAGAAGGGGGDGGGGGGGSTDGSPETVTLTIITDGP